jgi:hypothetical protein
MSGATIPVGEFDYEMSTTRRLLERVPAEQGRWSIYGPTADEPG